MGKKHENRNATSHRHSVVAHSGENSTSKLVMIHLLITFQFWNMRLKWHYVVIIINVWKQLSQTTKQMMIGFVVFLRVWVCMCLYNVCMWWFEYGWLCELAHESIRLFVFLAKSTEIVDCTDSFDLVCHIRHKNKCRNRNYFKSKQQQQQQ